MVVWRSHTRVPLCLRNLATCLNQAMSEENLRILIADDHDIVRHGTRALIEHHPGWEVCGLAANGREAVAQANELKPDIVIVDMSMPELNGLEAAIQIKGRLP